MVIETIIKFRTFLSAEAASVDDLANEFGQLRPHSYDSDIRLLSNHDPAIRRIEVHLDVESGQPESVELFPAQDCTLTVDEMVEHFGAFQERVIDDAEEEECAEFDIDLKGAPFRTRLLVEYDSFDLELEREVLMSLLIMREERL